MLNPVPGIAYPIAATPAFTAAVVQLDTESYASVVVTADTLTTDTIAVFIVTPTGALVPAMDLANAVAVLSATKMNTALRGGPTYAFAKTGTTDTTGLYWCPTGRQW